SFPFFSQSGRPKVCSKREWRLPCGCANALRAAPQAAFRLGAASRGCRVGGFGGGRGREAAAAERGGGGLSESSHAKAQRRKGKGRNTEEAEGAEERGEENVFVLRRFKGDPQRSPQPGGLERK